jgi:hypothetical protein
MYESIGTCVYSGDGGISWFTIPRIFHKRDDAITGAMMYFRSLYKERHWDFKEEDATKALNALQEENLYKWGILFGGGWHQLEIREALLQ